MSFEGKSLGEIQAEMNKRFADGSAYQMQVSWDSDRCRRIHQAVLELSAPAFVAAVGNAPTVLDLGAGEGGVVSFFPPPQREGQYEAVEISEVAVAKARAAHPLARYHVSPVETFDHPEGRRFNLITAVETIEHWADARAGLRTVVRHLGAGGRFVMTTPNYDSLHHRIGRKLGIPTPFCSSDHVHEFGYEEMRSLLDEAGLRIVQSTGVGLTPYWALEHEFRGRIRRLTDDDPEVIAWLGEAGKHIPHLAFIQCHACVKKED